MWHREEELDETVHQLEKEHAKVNWRLGHRGDGGRARARTSEMNWQIADDHKNLPNFARVEDQQCRGPKPESW